MRAPNPVLFLDEVEKAGGARDGNGRAHGTLLAMVEPESAAAWFDECLRSAADLRHVVWIMAANETRGIPAPLLSRLSVHRIDPPPAEAFGTTLGGLLEAVAEDLGCGPEDITHVSSSFRYDLMTAYDLGIKSKVWVNRRHEPANPYYEYTEIKDIGGLAAAVGLEEARQPA